MFAFCHCHRIREIILPENVELIGESAFSSCLNLQRITIPPKVELIEKSCFSNCDKLEEVIFSGKIRQIRSSAFTGCKMLHRIIFPEGLLKISRYAFSWCIMLKEIRFPQSLQKIREYAFSNCRNLENVYFSEDNVTQKHDKSFYQCDKIFTQRKLTEKMYGELTEEEKRFEPKFCLSGEDFHEDTPIIILKCGHFSEKEALLEWIEIANKCPFCRVNLNF